MTRQEAAGKIEYIIDNGQDYGYWTDAQKKALNMAIKALEQEPCEDAVSRKAVLDKAYAYGNGLEPEGYCVEVEDVQALPSVAPTVEPKPVITEEVGEAIMQLTMCAREECHMCKYEGSCCFNKQVVMATENMNTIFEAFTERPSGAYMRGDEE